MSSQATRPVGAAKEAARAIIISVPTLPNVEEISAGPPTHHSPVPTHFTAQVR